MDEPTCRKCGQLEETAYHLLFDCEVLGQIRFTVFGLAVGIPKENMAGCIIKYCRLMDLLAQ